MESPGEYVIKFSGFVRFINGNIVDNRENNKEDNRENNKEDKAIIYFNTSKVEDKAKDNRFTSNFEVIKSVEELETICKRTKTPWANKHFSNFMRYMKKSNKYNGYVFHALLCLCKLQESRGLAGRIIDVISVIDDAYNIIAKSNDNL